MLRSVSVVDYLNFNSANWFQNKCLSTTSVNEVLIVDVIKELSCNSTAGPDGVPVVLLKNSPVELAKAKPLNILFNHSISMGHVPSTRKAAVVPIYHGGDRYLAKNYQPVPLTSATKFWKGSPLTTR